jgi:DNA-binding beta-propeller fold protein YncE
VFVSNVLNATITRLDLAIPPFGDSVSVLSMTTIGSGYGHRGDPANLVIGPTGLAFDALHDKLFVASTLDNTILAISNAAFRQTSAGKGSVVFQDPHLRGPLGLVLLPDGNLITANGDAVNGDPTQPSELVEFTPTGHFVGETSIDPGQAGAFGIAINVQGDNVTFAAVDDNSNSLKIWDFES